MNVKRGNLLILDVIYLVGLILTTIISFTVFSEGFQYFSFWIGLTASFVAITALWFYVRYVMKNMECFKRFVPGFIAIGIVLTLYLGCVIFYSFFAGFADHALRWFVLLHIVTAAIAFILCAILLIYIRSASQQEASQQLHITNWKSIETALHQLLYTLDNYPVLDVDKIKESVKSIIELVKYSDPITPASLQHNDHQIFQDIESLREELALQYAAGVEMNSERLFNHISRLKSRLQERNQQILINKS